MGNYMSQVSASFKIESSNFDKAFQAIKASSLDPCGGCNIQEALNEFSWATETDEAGDIFSIFFEGEKYTDEDSLFETIAPFVEAGSYIEVEHEYGMQKWIFDGKTVKIKEGRVVYDD